MSDFTLDSLDQDTDPANNDYVLTYDVSAGTYKKVLRSDFVGHIYGGMYVDTGDNLTLSGTTPVEFGAGAEDYDAAMPLSGITANLTTGRLTVPVTGDYRVSWSWSIDLTAGANIAFAVMVNGTAISGRNVYRNVDGVGYGVAAQEIIISLTAGDTISLAVARTVAGSTTVENSAITLSTQLISY